MWKSGREYLKKNATECATLSFSLTLLSLTPLLPVLFLPLWVFGTLSAIGLPGPEEAQSVEASAAFSQVSLNPPPHHHHHGCVLVKWQRSQHYPVTSGIKKQSCMATAWRNFHNTVHVLCCSCSESFVTLTCHTGITYTIGANVCLTGFLNSVHSHQIKGRSSCKGEREFTGVNEELQRFFTGNQIVIFKCRSL